MNNAARHKARNPYVCSAGRMGCASRTHRVEVAAASSLATSICNEPSTSNLNEMSFRFQIVIHDYKSQEEEYHLSEGEYGSTGAATGVGDLLRPNVTVI